MNIRILGFTGIMLAAFALCGCGSNVSAEKTENTSNMKTSELEITVIGATGGLEEGGDTKTPQGADVNASGIQNAGQEKDTGISGAVCEYSGILNVKSGAHSDSKRIICWGDSLTEGTGGDGISFPSRLAELTGMDVKNYGVFSEKASLIAAREGGNPVSACDIEEIPSACEKVRLSLVDDENGDWEMWCVFGDAGINPCRIAGVDGTLEIDPSDGTRYFTRLTEGAAVPITGDNNRFYTFAMLDKKPGDILVIWSGSTDGWDEDRNLDSIIAYQKAMLDYADCSEYVIINYTAKPNIGDEIDSWNDRLKAEYGEHLVDARGYLLEYGLEDAGIKATDQDLKDISAGQIPQSLRTDDSHGTAQFYRIVGNLVYEKLIELGYISQ